MQTPFQLLRELLDDDRRAGLPWSPEDFAQRVWLACRETPGGIAWRHAIIDTYPAWQDAYIGRGAGALEQFDPVSLADEEPGERVDVTLV